MIHTERSDVAMNDLEKMMRYANDMSNLGVIAPHKVKYIDRYNIDWLTELIKSNKPVKYVCFWHEGNEYPNHVFSQWYEGKHFAINGRTYFTAEQYMMSEKALLFNDFYHYTLILQEKSPKACKELGRAVQGFDSDLWDASLREIVFHGNLGKFQADIGLVYELLKTENAVLIEASPYDGIYGAGISENKLLNEDGSLKVLPQNWINPKNGTQAQNHLGFVLMGIRDLFRELMHHTWYPGEEEKTIDF